MTEPIVRLACRAMNTRFEVACWGREEAYLTSAAEEALREIEALDRQLSFYRDDSDVRRLNVYAAHEPAPVDPRLFRLLQRAKELSSRTEGAFDITVAPLLRAWGFIGEGGRVPSDDEVAAARELTGMHLVELDAEAFTVHFLREGVLIDLGAIGKGYAIERAAQLLRDAELPGALIHGGTSTVEGIGTQPDGSPWRVAIQDPRIAEAHLAIVELQDAALSVSAVHGKFFSEGDARYGHVLDPRSGAPVQGALLAAVVCSSAADSDALSTGMLVLGEALFPGLETLRPEARALVVRAGERGESTVLKHRL